MKSRKLKLAEKRKRAFGVLKMTKQQELQYGFNAGKTDVKTFFERIPLYPEVTNLKQMAKKWGYTSIRINSIMKNLPVLAPVIQDDKIISRLK